MLAARLTPALGQCLLQQDLETLSSGLEGRTTNQISLLMDALLHPGADIGLEMEPLVEFRKTGNKIDHVVLGKGPPGGSWHRMDPQILTLSLASWMSLPGLPFHSTDSREKRAYACDVANYYVQYTEKMDLNKHFRNNVQVTSAEPVDCENKCHNLHSEKARTRKNNWVKKINKEIKESVEACIEPESVENREEYRSCFISNAINCLMMRGRRKSRCKRSKEQMVDDNPMRVINLNRGQEKKRSISFCCDSSNVCDRYDGKSFNDSINIYSLRNSCSLDYNSVPLSYNFPCCDSNSNWIVNALDGNTGEKITYSCKYLVLATGGNDLPNRLDISKSKKDPSWLLYDSSSLEHNLNSYVTERKGGEVDPILIVGAGLSAADAVIAARAKNVPVIHVFRNKSPDLNKQLPENLYPEYHKVHQMMVNPDSTYPLYTAYPEYNLTDLNDKSRTITLTSKEGKRVELNVSFAVVLVGSRPDLSFLPQNFKLAIRKNLPLDCKTNPVDINRLSHSVIGYDNLFVIGPLAGDNFVRFLPGGALAVVSELYRRNNYS
nr:oxidative stress-induced growth inhibitor 2-like [Leptinotarsa decemlineata]